MSTDTILPPGRRGSGRPGVMLSTRVLGALAALAMLAALVFSPRAAAADTNAAGLVVRHGDGRLVYVYVEFTEPELTGMELLTRSGLATEVTTFSGLGSAVCSLDGEGCPSDDCFCQSDDNPSYYWQYLSLTPDGTWNLEMNGPDNRTVRDGDVDGWSWAADDPQLPAISIDEIARLNGVDGQGAGDGAEPRVLAIEVDPSGQVTTRTAQPEEDDGSMPTTYLAFGALLIAAAGVAMVTVLRRRRSGSQA